MDYLVNNVCRVCRVKTACVDVERLVQFTHRKNTGETPPTTCGNEGHPQFEQHLLLRLLLDD